MSTRLIDHTTLNLINKAVFFTQKGMGPEIFSLKAVSTQGCLGYLLMQGQYIKNH